MQQMPLDNTAKTPEHHAGSGACLHCQMPGYGRTKSCSVCQASVDFIVCYACDCQGMPARLTCETCRRTDAVSSSDTKQLSDPEQAWLTQSLFEPVGE